MDNPTDLIIHISNHPRGVEFLRWLYNLCSIHHTAFTPDHDTTMFNLGRQSISQDIMTAIIEADPALYVRIIRENMEGEEDAGGTDDQLGLYSD